MPSPYFTRDVLITGSIPYAANTQQQLQIPSTDLYEFLDIFMAASVTTAGYTAAPTQYVEAPENLMAMLTLNPSANSPGGINENFKMTDASWLRHKHLLEYGTDCDRTLVNPGTNGTFSVSTNPRMFFAHRNVTIGGRSQKLATAFDARFTSTTYLQVLWRDQNALLVQGSGTGGTIAVNASTQITCKARTIQNVANVINGQPVKNYYVRELQQTQQVTATGLDQVFTNLRTQAILKRLGIKTTVGIVPWAEFSDAPLGGNTTRPEGPHFNLRVNQSAYAVQQTYKMEQQSDKKDYGLQGSWPVGRVTYDSAKRSGQGNFAVEQMLDLTNEAQFDLMADTLFTAGQQNTIQFTYEELARVK